MRPEGTIYRQKKAEKRGEKRLAMTAIERFAFRLVRVFGMAFVAAAIVGFGFLYGPLIQEEFNYRFGNEESTYLSGFGRLIRLAEADAIERVQSEANSYGVDTNYSIVIPKIDAASNVIANVNAGDEDVYLEALSQGVAHAQGTGFPGQGQKSYLFSHSTDSPFNTARYNAVFYLLRKLETDDTIIVFFADQKYTYKVTEKLVVAADDVSWLTEPSDKETLVLQTCDPPGTTWKRLLIIAEPIKNVD